jgi:hypothetical protein
MRDDVRNQSYRGRIAARFSARLHRHCDPGEAGEAIQSDARHL